LEGRDGGLEGVRGWRGIERLLRARSSLRFVLLWRRRKKIPIKMRRARMTTLPPAIPKYLPFL
jgi:hypothetical protein